MKSCARSTRETTPHHVDSNVMGRTPYQTTGKPLCDTVRKRALPNVTDTEHAEEVNNLNKNSVFNMVKSSLMNLLRLLKNCVCIRLQTSNAYLR